MEIKESSCKKQNKGFEDITMKSKRIVLPVSGLKNNFMNEVKKYTLDRDAEE